MDKERRSEGGEGGGMNEQGGMGGTQEGGMAVRQICLYLDAGRVDCVCECRFIDSHSVTVTVTSCGHRRYCREIFYSVDTSNIDFLGRDFHLS